MKSVQRLILLQLKLFLLWQFAAMSSALASDDWQYWNEFQLKHSIKENLDLRLKAEQRLRDDFTDLFLNNYEVGLIFKPSKHFEFGPLYKFEHEKSLSGQKTDENRVSLEGTLKWWHGDSKFSNRHKIEYRSIDGKESWRYRSRIKVSHPMKIADFMITPFIAEEIFYDTVPDQINQNRFSIGFSRQISKNTELQIFFMLKSKRAGRDWNEVNVLGTTLGISF
jgi:hypothetical protein